MQLLMGMDCSPEEEEAMMASRHTEKGCWDRNSTRDFRLQSMGGRMTPESVCIGTAAGAACEVCRMSASLLLLSSDGSTLFVCMISWICACQ